MRVAILLVFFAVILTLSPSLKGHKKGVNYVNLACKLNMGAAKKLAKRHGMKIVHESSGLMDSVNMLGFGLDINRPLTREEARVILLDCIQELITTVNENEQIRPFLKNYPFTTKNIRVSVYSSQPDWGFVYDPYITVASISESNEVYYRTKDKDPAKKYVYKNEYHESYEEALALVKMEKK